jgi:hypothetical protein
MILADAATANLDNTFSLLRGGISQLNVVKDSPALFKGALVIRIWGTEADAGPHDLTILCTEPNGEPIFKLHGKDKFTLSPKGGSVHSVIELGLAFPRPNIIYKFSVLVDDVELADWPIEVLQLK